MSQATLIGPPQSFTGIEARRSTRIDRAVPLIIYGQNKLGQQFQERTAAVSLNLHGCRYPSRHEYRVGTWVTLFVADPSGAADRLPTRAQVRSIHTPGSPRELYQIGVELEIPSNVWGISPPPGDWLHLSGSSMAMTQSAAAIAPARESMVMNMTLPAGQFTEELPPPVSSMAPPAQETAPPEPPKETVAAKSPRIVITPDNLVAALQGKLRQAAEKAVQAALADHLEPAVREALHTLDEVRQSNSRQMENSSAQYLESLFRASREEVSTRLESGLEDVRGRSEEQFDAVRGRVDEIAQRIDSLTTRARQDFTNTQQLLDRTVREFEARLSARFDDAVARAAEGFEGAAARVSDRRLVRLIEETEVLTRQASSQIEARAAEARSTLETALRGTLDEFRRQAEIQAEFVASDTSQRVSSSLASMDAESRAACEARRKALVGDVTRTGEQLTEQFRHGLKAFFYSCLVAAVGAVEEHSKTTFDGLTQEGELAPREITGTASAQEKIMGEDEQDTPPPFR